MKHIAPLISILLATACLYSEEHTRQIDIKIESGDVEILTDIYKNKDGKVILTYQVHYIKRRDKGLKNLKVYETVTWTSSEKIPDDAVYYRFPDTPAEE